MTSDDQSKSARKPHPADGMVKSVDCGGGAHMNFQNPAVDQSLGWSLTWATDARPFLLSAASVIGSYDYLLSGDISMTEATRRLRLLRDARKEAANAR